MKASDKHFTGWRQVKGYYCYIENGQIVRILDEKSVSRFLWKPANGGLDAIPRCSIPRFYQGLKRGTVVIR